MVEIDFIAGIAVRPLEELW